MRLNINLASQRYEVAQSYVRRMTVAIAALGVIAVLLAGYILYQRQNSRDINRQIAEVKREIDSLSGEESQARAILSKPANHVIADESDFLNQLFARKSLSWTRIFTEMEKIVPPGLHVVSMKPEYTKTNDLLLHVIVATDSRERAVEMVRNMEKSAHLRQAQIDAEVVTTGSGDQAAGGGSIQFDIAAAYVPGVAESDTTPEQEAKPKEKGNMNGTPPKRAAAPASTPARASVNTPPGASVGRVVTASPIQPVQPAPSMNAGTVSTPAPNVTYPQSGVTSASPNAPQPGSMAPGVGWGNNTASPNVSGSDPALRRPLPPGRLGGR